MRVLPLLAVSLLLTSATQAEEKRHLDAHEHGHGTFDMAIEGNTVQIALEAPGADIIGFEHAASTAEDKAAMAEATAKLMKPMALFVMPAAAHCRVAKAEVEFEMEEHDHDKNAGHADKEHKGEAEAHGAFHATYELTCTKPDAITRIEFAYFAVFAGAEELDVQLISEKGQNAFEVTRDAPVLTLGGMI